MGGEKEKKSHFNFARERAQRRRSPVNLLLPVIKFPLMLGLWFLQVEFLYRLFSRSGCGDIALRCLNDGLPVVIFTVTPFFPAVGLSMLLTNLLLWLIPPVRRIFDREAERFPQTSFRRSQYSLVMFTGVCIVLAWPAMFMATRFF